MEIRERKRVKVKSAPNIRLLLRDDMFFFLSLPFPCWSLTVERGSTSTRTKAVYFPFLLSFAPCTASRPSLFLPLLACFLSHTRPPRTNLSMYMCINITFFPPAPPPTLPLPFILLPRRHQPLSLCQQRFSLHPTPKPTIPTTSSSSSAYPSSYPSSSSPAAINASASFSTAPRIEPPPTPHLQTSDQNKGGLRFATSSTLTEA